MKIGINASALLTSPDLGAMAEHAAQAESDGFASWWLAQTGLVDALGVFTALGSHTDSIELGTAVVPTFMRHPTVLAGQAMTAQAATDGGIAVGIGLSHKPVIEDRFGMTFERPVRHMSEYVAILDDLVRTGSTDRDGDLFTAHAQTPRPYDDAPQVLIAALDPQMLKLCGARTDGSVLWMVGPATIAAHIAPVLAEAAAGAGRAAPRVVCSLPTMVCDDEAEGRAFCGAIFAGYGELPSYRAMLDREGQARNPESTPGSFGPGDVCVVGDEDSVRAQLADIASAGATEFTAVEVGRTPDEQSRTRAVLKELV